MVPSSGTVVAAALWVGPATLLAVVVRLPVGSDRAAEDPQVRDRIDGGMVSRDDRVNDRRYAHPPDHDVESPDGDPEAVATTACRDRDTVYRRPFMYCRECGEELPR